MHRFPRSGLRQLPAVQALRVMLIHNYVRVTDGKGREVIKRRESLEAGGEGIPPGRVRLTSPYDTDARWAAKGDDLVWNGYKLHVSESCDNTAETSTTSAAVAGAEPMPPNLITNVTTTDATVPDGKATEKIHQALARRGLIPGEHYLDSGYPSAELLVGAREKYGIALITPMLLDHSRQSKAQADYDWTATQKASATIRS
ncbi:hypothetical protein AB0K12_15335 [Nonomuraea sp. NPDC049419]|uniref:hypothetical protein n=1 Tax=Nonomuraea sp. NPDC049419 TaxID=3155772 RepID=UPI003412A753